MDPGSEGGRPGGRDASPSSPGGKSEWGLDGREADASWQDLNTTLRILVDHRNEDMVRSREALARQVEDGLRPLIRLFLRRRLNGRQRLLAEALDRTLALLQEPLRAGGPGAEVELSPREMLVAHLQRIGRSVPAAAAILGVSPRTIASHRRRIQAKSRAAAAPERRTGTPPDLSETLPVGPGGNPPRDQLPPLQQMNRRLKALLQDQGQDRQRLHGAAMENLRFLVQPLTGLLEQTPLDPVQQRLMGDLRQGVTAVMETYRPPWDSRIYRLTAAERRVALEVRKGLSTRALAARLGLSPRTVEAHRLSLRRKLGLARRGGNLRSRLLTLMGPSAEAPDNRGGGQPAS